MSLPRSSWCIPALLPILALAACTTTRYDAQQAPVAINITLNEDNTVTVDPDRIEVPPGTRIRWFGDEPFAVVVVEHRTLFPDTPAQAMGGLANRPLNATIGRRAPPGNYKYTVVVWDDEDGELRLEDPEIVVQSPPGGGP